MEAAASSSSSSTASTASSPTEEAEPSAGAAAAAGVVPMDVDRPPAAAAAAATAELPELPEADDGEDGARSMDGNESVLLGCGGSGLLQITTPQEAVDVWNWALENVSLICARVRTVSSIQFQISAKPFLPSLPAVVAQARPAHPGPVPRHGLPVPAVAHLAGGRRRGAAEPARAVPRERSRRGRGPERGADAAFTEQASDVHFKWGL